MVISKPKSIYHEMWNDNSQEFLAVIKRMRKLGYRVIVANIEKEYQQNQFIGTEQKVLNR